MNRKIEKEALNLYSANKDKSTKWIAKRISAKHGVRRKDVIKFLESEGNEFLENNSESSAAGIFRTAGILGAGAAAAAAIAIGAWSLCPQENTQEIPAAAEIVPLPSRSAYERKDSEQVDIASLPVLVIEETKEKYPLPQEQMMAEVKSLLEDPNVKYGPLRGARKVIAAKREYDFKAHIVRLEPNMEYSNRLIGLAEDSIGHFLDFVDSKFIERPEIKFVVPKKASDIRMKNDSGVLIYVVAGYGERKSAAYIITTDKKKFAVDRVEDEYIAGESGSIFRLVRNTEGYTVAESSDNALFYSTSGSITDLVETPVIEVFHRCVRKYTKHHFEEAVRELSDERKILFSTGDACMQREERIVHAVSMLWWHEYNQDMELGFTEEEIEGSFERYLTEPKYAGTHKTAERIREIGVQRAIELYATNPDELFRE